MFDRHVLVLTDYIAISFFLLCDQLIYLFNQVCSQDFGETASFTFENAVNSLDITTYDQLVKGPCHEPETALETCEHYRP